MVDWFSIEIINVCVAFLEEASNWCVFGDFLWFVVMFFSGLLVYLWVESGVGIEVANEVSVSQGRFNGVGSFTSARTSGIALREVEGPTRHIAWLVERVIIVRFTVRTVLIAEVSR